jgi:hypothetical protein
LLLECEQGSLNQAVVHIHFSRFGVRCMQRAVCVGFRFAYSTYLRLLLNYR